MTIKERLRSVYPKRWFRAGGFLDRLLDVAAAGIQPAADALAEFWREIFVTTAVTTLDERERRHGLSSGGHLTLDERRRRIIARQHERGGPTNTENFRAALTLLAGAEATSIPDYPNFAVTYEMATMSLDTKLLEEYIHRNKLGHLRHSYRLTGGATGTIEHSVAAQTAVYTVQPPTCGAFYAGGEPDL